MVLGKEQVGEVATTFCVMNASFGKNSMEGGWVGVALTTTTREQKHPSVAWKVPLTVAGGSRSLAAAPIL